jgi:hypothetical protein
MKEGVDYTLVPVPHNEQSFLVRIDVEKYKDTFVRYKNVVIDEKTKQITFDVSVIKTPHEDLDDDFVETCSHIIQSVVNSSFEDGNLILMDLETGEYVEQ